MSYWSFSTKPLVLNLHIVVNICFTSRCANKFFHNLIKKLGTIIKNDFKWCPNWNQDLLIQKSCYFLFHLRFQGTYFCKLCEVLYFKHNELMPSSSHW